MGVLGHRSMPSGTPSLSASLGHPFASTVAPAGVLGHWSMPSGTPSWSASVGHPFASTCTPGGVVGARLGTERDAVREGDAIAHRRVHRVVGELVGCGIAEVEA